MRSKIAVEAPNSSQTQESLSLGRINRTWWPLASSWVLIGIEHPIVIAAIARLPDPEINLAALGGIVMAVTFVTEAPLLALLTASATLSKDWGSYRWLRRFAVWGIALLTLVHALIAFTPLYDLLVTKIISAPAEIIQPGRIGLMLTSPYLSAVAYRRFNQGVLIRFGHSASIAAGTLTRLFTIGLVVVAGYLIGSVSGVIVAAVAMTAGVWAEAIYAALRVRPVLRNQVKPAPRVNQTLSLGSFLKFYIPLATTSVVLLVMRVISSGALSRMPEAVVSLAVWSALFGVIMMLASGGMAMVEVVVTLLDQPMALPSLRRFTILLGALTGLLAFILAATPLGELWFSHISGLSPSLLVPARRAVWLVLPITVAIATQGLFQGVLAHARHTRPVTEAVFISSLITLAIYGAGVAWGRIAGIYVIMATSAISAIVQALWLWHRSRRFRRTLAGCSNGRVKYEQLQLDVNDSMSSEMASTTCVSCSDVD